MAWRRGFFRLWVVASALWALGCALVLQPWTSAERAWSLRSEYAEIGSPVVRPRDDRRNLVRIKQNVQRMADVQEGEAAIDRYIASEGVTVASVRNTTLEPEERYYSGPVVTLHQAQALTNARYRRERGEVVAFFAFTFVPIITAFSFGVVVAWVLSGFRNPQG